MGAHPDHTWGSLIDPTMDKTKSENYINWLTHRDLLPNVLPTARIMRFGYASNWFGRDMVHTRVSKIGQKLLKGLARMRKNASHRPMILIAHSFGGLVILSMLLDAAKSHEPSFNSIHESTKGVVFLGTPFRGAHRSLSHGEVLLLAEDEEIPSNLHNLIDLQAGAGSLIDLIDGYIASAKGCVDRAVICVYEEKETNIAALVNKTKSEKVLLVDESSGALEGSIKISRPCNHFEINKFGSPDSETWQELADHLLAIKEKAQRQKQENASAATARDNSEDVTADSNHKTQNIISGNLSNSKYVMQGNSFNGIGNMSFG